MARFLFDIANLKNPQKFMEELCGEFSDDIVTIQCLDESNDNQFHDDPTKNRLTKKQIEAQAT